MTATTNALWVTDPAAYKKRLRDMLGSRDPFEVLGKTADVLTDIVAKQSTARMQSRPFPGKWTPLEVIGHLCDAEWVYGYRMRMTLAEPEPTILGMDQDLWVAAQRYNERDPSDVITDFRALRSINLAQWRQLKPDDFKRFGRHNERGPESLAEMLPMLAGHDLWHIDQINRYLAAATGM